MCYAVRENDEYKIKGLDMENNTQIFNEEEARGSHYVGTDGKDTVDELYEEGLDVGHYFCYGNIKKYTKRLGKKGSNSEETKETMKKDLYKIAKYATLMLKHEYGINYKLVRD